ncbi:SRPBCC family protein [Niabella ginsengisoli]|uniref:SRPBCC family protein n=1 Tax=Niabella ginsengisoli TaxID=522298 RepID=A0ABS9SNU0_9BACT|nr:SRPBCC family protein [Niabella ginsengisoli]MCH5600025.1 SRPBCC family protein [Niabella ginsengisoli]
MNIKITYHSGIYTLEAKQQLNCDLQTAWDFFGTPENLQAITPNNMGFEITSGADGKIYPGKIITYTISIFPVIKSKWVTEITQIAMLQYFIDEQRNGPYTLWHHEHHFENKNNGVLMTDIVSYKLPAGFLGRSFAGKMVAKKLKEIFSFRYEVLHNRFA